MAAVGSALSASANWALASSVLAPTVDHAEIAVKLGQGLGAAVVRAAQGERLGELLLGVSELGGQVIVFDGRLIELESGSIFRGPPPRRRGPTRRWKEALWRGTKLGDDENKATLLRNGSGPISGGTMATSEGRKMTATLRTSQTRITSTEPPVKNDEDNRTLVGERRTRAGARGPPRDRRVGAAEFAVRDRDQEECPSLIGGTFARRPDGTRLHREFEAAPISRVASARR